MSTRPVAIIFIGIGSLFVAMGDLRNLISPLGYWILWAVWLVIGLCFSFFSILKTFRNKIATIALPLGVFLGFFGLSFSFLISAAINDDFYTAYQGAKFVSVAAIGGVFFYYSRDLDGRDLYVISLLVILASYALFEYSKIVDGSWYIELGDGRQGSIIRASALEMHAQLMNFLN